MAALDPERWQVVKQILQQALDRDPDARPSFLEEACGGDAELKREVERLLAHHDQAQGEGFLSEDNANVIQQSQTQPLQEHTISISDVKARGTATPDHSRDADSSNDKNAPPPGTKVRYFGDYELLEEIARGGMGVVYKARQMKLNRIVALKMILSGELASKEDVQRFYSEAESAAQLDHPGIVPIFEVGEHAGQHFFSMGYVDGESLSHRIADSPLPPQEAAEVIRSVASAVQYAHEKGVIHRDLKPANILLKRSRQSSVESPEQERSRSGSEPSTLNAQPMVTDFGLAKRVKGDSDLTASGQILGTPGYMPPEQAAGRIAEVRETADVYSLGAVLYATLTGRPPFQADNPLDTLFQVLEREAVPPRQLNPSVPRDLETICLKCLEKDRRRRYASAQDVADEFGRYLNGEPIIARPISRPARAWRWCRRNPIVAGLTTAVAVALVLGTIISSHFSVRAGAEARRATAEKRRADQKADVARAEAERADRKAEEAAENAKLAKAKATEALREKRRADKNAADAEKNAAQARREQRAAERLLYASNMNLVQEAWRSGRLKFARRLLDLYRAAPEATPDYVGFEWRYWQGVCNAEERIFNIPGWVEQLAYTPDGRYLVANTADGITLWNAFDGAEEASLPAHHGGTYARLAFNSDGKRMATTGGDRKIIVWNVAKRQQELVIGPLDAAARMIAFDHDGKRLAGGLFDHSVRIWNAESGAEMQKLDGHEELVLDVAFGPDGNRLVSSSGDDTVKIWDLEKGNVVFNLQGHSADVPAVAYSPNGRQIVSASLDKTLKTWDAATGRLTGTLAGHTRGVTSVAFSPDGRHVVSGSADQSAKVWDVATTEELFSLKGHSEIITAVAFRSDGAQIATGSKDRTIRMWRAKRDPLAVRLEIIDPVNSVSSVAFSPDSQRLVTGSGSRSSLAPGTVKLWDASSGDLIRNFGGSLGGVLTVAFNTKRYLVAAGTRDGVVKVWNAANGVEVLTIDEGIASSPCVAFSPDGELLAIAANQSKGTAAGEVQVWSLSLKKLQRTFTAFKVRLADLVFAPKNNMLAVAEGDGSLHVWDFATNKLLFHRQGSGSHWSDPSLAFSPDGEQLAVSVGRRVTILSLPTGKETMEFDGHPDRVNCVGFSPDGERLVTGTGSGAYFLAGDVTVWDLTSRQRMLVVKADVNVRGLRSSSRGHYYYGLRPGKTAESIAFSPDGNKLGIGHGDGTVSILDAPPSP